MRRGRPETAIDDTAKGDTRRLLKHRTARKLSIDSVLERRKAKADGRLIEAETPELELNPALGYLTGRGAPNLIRKDAHTHVSDLLHKCPRALAYSRLSGLNEVASVTSEGESLVFAIGRAIQEHFTARLIERAPEAVYSNAWSCACGGLTEIGTKQAVLDRGRVCRVCGRQADRYQELLLVNGGLNLSGSVDLTLELHRKLYLVEVKSIKKDSWKELVRPLPIHILQIVFYWWLARECGLEVHDKVSVIYVSKEAVRGAPYKEFSFRADTHVGRLEPYIREAELLAIARVRGKPLPTRVCPSIDSTQAKACPHALVCFAE